MNNYASERMLQAVTSVKESAAKAEREYDFGAEKIQRKASSNINLFGGSAVNQVADIVSESRKICDSLYASYQMLVKMLDEQCRPLLDQEPELSAVRAVKDLIEWLNDESEIENNFSASLNSNDLGGVASRRYVPTIENKMIQSFWETKYDMWPGRLEAEAEERRKTKEAAEQKKQEQKKKKEEAAAKYEQEYAIWKQKTDEVETYRAQELEKELSETINIRKNEIQEKYEKTINSANAELSDCEIIKTEAETRLAAVGFFKFAEKKKEKSVIKEMAEKIAKVTLEIESAEKDYAQATKELPAWIETKRSEIKKVLVDRYPLPAKPEKNPSQNIKQAILDGMKPGILYSPSDLLENIPELEDVTSQIIAALLRQLVNDGRVERIDDRRKSYFQLV